MLISGWKLPDSGFKKSKIQSMHTSGEHRAVEQLGVGTLD